MANQALVPTQKTGRHSSPLASRRYMKKSDEEKTEWVHCNKCNHNTKHAVLPSVYKRDQRMSPTVITSFPGKTPIQCLSVAVAAA